MKSTAQKSDNEDYRETGGARRGRSVAQHQSAQARTQKRRPRPNRDTATTHQLPDAHLSQPSTNTPPDSRDVDENAAVRPGQAQAASTVMKENFADDFTSLFMKFPPFVKREQLQNHIRRHGLGENIVDIEMHVFNTSNRKPAGSAKVIITPLSLRDKFISTLNGSCLWGKYSISVEPYRERKQVGTKAPQHRRQQPQAKQSCVLFVGPVLPHYINRSHILTHFSECKDSITDVKFKADRRRRGCSVLLTFKSSSSAMNAIEKYNRTLLLDKHKIKMDLYRPHQSMSSSASCPTMPVSSSYTVLQPGGTKSEQPAEKSKSFVLDKADTRDKMTAKAAKRQSPAVSEGGSVGEVPSFGSTDDCSEEWPTLGEEYLPYYDDFEDDQLQNTVTTVIVENLEPKVTQKEIEKHTDVKIIHYTPSHLTPDKVAAWIEVANSKHACIVAEKLDGQVIHGKKVYCSLTDSRTLQQHSDSFPTFDKPPEEHLPLSQPTPSSVVIDSRVLEQHSGFPSFHGHDPPDAHLAVPNLPQSTSPNSLTDDRNVTHQHAYPSPSIEVPPKEQFELSLQEYPLLDHETQQKYLSALFFLGEKQESASEMTSPQYHYPAVPSQISSPAHAYVHPAPCTPPEPQPPGHVVTLRAERTVNHDEHHQGNPTPYYAPHPPTPSSVVPLRAERTVNLDEHQWNHLTKRHKSGTTILQEVIAPFKSNPNVNIELQLETFSIKIGGVPDAVISAHDHISNQLNRDIHVQNRTEMGALVHLHPSLPQDIVKRHAVTVTGFQETSSVLRLEGAVSAVMAARTEIIELVSQVIVTWLTPEFPLTLLPLAKAQLRSEECSVYVYVPEAMDDPTACASHSDMIAICATNEKACERAAALFKGTPKEKEVILPCSTYGAIDKVAFDKHLKQLEEKYCVMTKRKDVSEPSNSQHDGNKIIVIGFQDKTIEMAHREIQGFVKLHSEQYMTLDLKPEEMMYLLKLKGVESRSLFSLLPAKVTIEGNKIQLFGSVDSISKSKEKILGGPLLDLRCKRFSFQCNQKFLSQLKDSLLKPLKNNQRLDFQWLIIQPESQGYRKRDELAKSEQCIADTEAGGFEIVVYSKDESVYNKVCEKLEVVDPQTIHYQLTYQQRREAAECARSLKGKLEAKCYIRMIVHQNNAGVIMHGLIPEEMQKCWEEINDEIKSTIETTKHVSLKRHESMYLERKYSDELKNEFKCTIAFPQSKASESASYAVRITGKIKDVEAVENKLSKLKEEIQIVTFTITCSQKSYSLMWRKWWFDLQKQQEENLNVMIHFDTTGMKRSRDGRVMVDVTFQVIGTDKDVLIGIQETINNEKTEQRVLDVREEGKVALLNAIGQQRSPISDKLAVAIDIDRVANRVLLVSPKCLSDDLNEAESEVRKFVGMYANISKEITSDNPVVGLVLASQSLSSTYLKLANDIAKLHKVTVIAMGAPLYGLKLTGSPAAIERVEPQIHTAVFKKVEAILGQTLFKIPSNHAALLATSEFSQVEAKLQSDYCVVLSYPRPGLTSKAAHTTTISLSAPSKPGEAEKTSTHSLQLDICLGNIVHERVDAIVNAANEDLKHIGGLAKGIVDNGGVTIQAESNRHVQTHGKVLTGSCVCLGAGKLACKKIIHAVGPQWRGGGKGEEHTLYSTIYKCLECADSESLTSIALPAISTGVYGVPEVVCARASLTAVRNYCQSRPTSSITQVKFILYTKSALQHFGSTFKYMFPIQSHTSTQSVLASTTAIIPEVAVTWSWRDDHGSFSSYSSDVSARLTKEYKRDPTSSVTCIINGQQYSIDFSTMIQTNCSTRYQRNIKRVPNPPASKSLIVSASQASQSVQWEYRNDSRSWSPYRSLDSHTIEEMYQDKTPGELTIHGNTYTFDFDRMCQINIRTKYKRQIQRVITASSSYAASVEEASEQSEATLEPDLTTKETPSCGDLHDQSKDEESIIITLRGPRDALPQARDELKEKVKSLYVSHVVVFPVALETKLTQLVNERNVTWSLEKSSSRGRKKKQRGKMIKMNVEGLTSEVAHVVMAINEEIVTYQVESEIAGTTLEYPEEWEEMGEATTKLVPLSPGTDEWSHVSEAFQSTMPSSTIVQITRIQNRWLWEKYDFQRKRMHKKNDGDINELELFHGTSNNDPKLIYENEIGFDMRYSNSGMWGQANYFAEKASYSHGYAYVTYDGYSRAGYREMFFAKVLTGDTYNCSSNSSLRKPPFKPAGSAGGSLQFAQVQYDTVTGYTRGSQVYMTYDNDKAYPAYLIKYT